MKQVLAYSIQNISGTDPLEKLFRFEYFTPQKKKLFTSVDGSSLLKGKEISSVEVFFIEDMLVLRKNEALLEKIPKYPAMWSEVYSPQSEIEIFLELWKYAFQEQKKIHIVGISLGSEIEMLEKYYTELGFFDSENNTFKVDFSLPLITVSIKIENIMWRGSDYKRMGEKIFFCPPIREAGEVKNLYRGLNRGVICSLFISDFTRDAENFLQQQIEQEYLLPLNLGRLLFYNLLQVGWQGKTEFFSLSYK